MTRTIPGPIPSSPNFSTTSVIERLTIDSLVDQITLGPHIGRFLDGISPDGIPTTKSHLADFHRFLWFFLAFQNIQFICEVNGRLHGYETFQTHGEPMDWQSCSCEEAMDWESTDCVEEMEWEEVPLPPQVSVPLPLKSEQENKEHVPEPKASSDRRVKKALRRL
ncbi:hypothetical protein AVEN_255401-1 [Araneus ventricosus]|uniref:Uncharacterized protein n=1 Tax=Araneus ventricosus TaxID=182803 RepID=A0A4Y2HTV8_ARAVE|nr:hypothetical protein AVEN_255401-1 [Araneus ventricosus]